MVNKGKVEKIEDDMMQGARKVLAAPSQMAKLVIVLPGGEPADPAPGSSAPPGKAKARPAPNGKRKSRLPPETRTRTRKSNSRRPPP